MLVDTYESLCEIFGPSVWDPPAELMWGGHWRTCRSPWRGDGAF